MFFSLEKKVVSWTYLLKKTRRKTKILISQVWKKILKTFFEFVQMKVEWSKNYFKISLSQEAEAFGKKNRKKKTQMQRPKLQNKIFTENICFSSSPVQVVVFCKDMLIL